MAKTQRQLSDVEKEWLMVRGSRFLSSHHAQNHKTSHNYFFLCQIETDGWKNAKPRYITELFWTSQGCSHCRVLRPFRLNSTLWHTTQQEPPTYVFWFVPKYDISHSLIFRNQTHIIVLNAQGTFEGTFGKKHKWLNGGFVWFTGDWGTTNAFRWKCD